MGLASDAELEARYAAVEDGGHLIPAIPYRQMDPKYFRQRVPDPTGEPAGTVVVDTPGRFLYLIEPGGTAMRYGVGIGREGFAWQGEGIIHWRQPWPRWKPPAEMIARKPELEKYSVANGGMFESLSRIGPLVDRLANRAIWKLAGARRSLEADIPLVSFTFDDVPDSALGAGAAILEKYGVRGTFYIAGGLAGQVEPDRSLITPEGCSELLARGHAMLPRSDAGQPGPGSE